MKFSKYVKTLLTSAIILCAQYPLFANESIAPLESQWKGKNVAFLGDSITDKIHVGTTKNYWQFLESYLGIRPLVYGINGQQMKDIANQATKMKSEIGDNVDAIFIFAGTNDFNAGIPLGEWYDFKDTPVEVSAGKIENRIRRTFSDADTFRGRINKTMSFLKQTFPDKQIILLTPIHRGYARFGDNNIQPDESYPNKIGLYIDSYVQIVKEAANVWAVPVIDLNSLCGLFPLATSHDIYFHSKTSDLLHPNARGHERMAKAIMYEILKMPSNFN